MENKPPLDMAEASPGSAPEEARPIVSPEEPVSDPLLGEPEPGPGSSETVPSALKRTWFGILSTMLAVFLVVSWACQDPLKPGRKPIPEVDLMRIKPVVDRIDDRLKTIWKEEGVKGRPKADDLLVLRRVSLSLHGTIPSLEEIRAFQADTKPHRLERWIQRALDDRRFPDYFAERLARGMVGTEGGEFVVYRRDRFVNWLADCLHADRPYDQVVEEMVSRRGLWTGKSAAVNFLMSAHKEGDFDEMKLASRTVRSFLGQRMDCAQCHDHPFDDWTQAQFEGLAAFYSSATVTIVGLEDKDREFKVQDRVTLEDRPVEPGVPFGEEWVPKEGALRQKLANWIIHPENKRFSRAVVNRVWGYVHGRPWYEPVDDLPDPDESEEDVIDILAEDLRMHHYSLKRLILILTSLAPFRMSSEMEGATKRDHAKAMKN